MHSMPTCYEVFVCLTHNITITNFFKNRVSCENEILIMGEEVGRLTFGCIRQSTAGALEDLCQASTTSRAAKCLLDGHFCGVLQDPFINSLLAPEDGWGASTIRSAAEFYNILSSRVHSCVHQALDRADKAALEALMTAGASCLNVFAQHNLTG